MLILTQLQRNLTEKPLRQELVPEGMRKDYIIYTDAPDAVALIFQDETLVEMLSKHSSNLEHLIYSDSPAITPTRFVYFFWTIFLFFV